MTLENQHDVLRPEHGKYSTEEGRIRLFEDAHLLLEYDERQVLFEARMRHPDRPCFTPELLASGERLFAALARIRARDARPGHLVWSSLRPGVFSLGGDLELFLSCLRRGDRAGLEAYARACLDLVWRSYHSFELGLRSLFLVEGAAFGGGFEAVLTGDVVIAEKGVRFGFPEILFGLFPGMGGVSLLQRRLRAGEARRLLEEGRSLEAEEMAALGLVQILAPEGGARRALARHLAARSVHLAADLALDRARKRAERLDRAELSDILELWLARAFALEPPMLRRMEHFARCQRRKSAA